MSEYERAHLASIHLEQSPDAVEEWKPSLSISIIWTALATVLTVVGFLLFSSIYILLAGSDEMTGSVADSSVEGDEVYFTIRLGGMLALLGVSIGVLLVHEAVHGLAFRYYGARPTFGAALVQKFLPVLYCSAPGYRFTRGQFAVIILAPLVIISLAGIAIMPFTQLGILLPFPLAVNFGGAVGDLWFIGLLLLRKPGTMVEDLKDGIRFHQPGVD